MTDMKMANDRDKINKVDFNLSSLPQSKEIKYHRHVVKRISLEVRRSGFAFQHEHAPAVGPWPRLMLSIIQNLLNNL